MFSVSRFPVTLHRMSQRLERVSWQDLRLGSGQTSIRLQPCRESSIDSSQKWQRRVVPSSTWVGKQRWREQGINRRFIQRFDGMKAKDTATDSLRRQ